MKIFLARINIFMPLEAQSGIGRVSFFQTADVVNHCTFHHISMATLKETILKSSYLLRLMGSYYKNISIQGRHN